ncbi:hypothetical protein Tco_0381040 [Tanacetum coccineum]
MESDEIIKSSVENLVPIPSEFEGIFDNTCDVPVCEDPSTFYALKDHSEILSDSNDDGISSDDDDFEDIEYVSLEKKLLNINHLISNIESLNDNPNPDRVLDSPSSFPIPVVDSDSFFKESNTSFSYSDNSLPEFEPFSDDTEETRSSSTTTHANNSLPEYDSFLFEIEPDQGELTNVVIEEVDTFLVSEDSIPLGFKSNFDPGGGEIDFSQNVKDDDSFTFFIRTFLPFLTYPADSPLLLSSESEDTIFDPGYPDFEDSRAHGTDIKEMDKNKDKTRQNRARDWKERKITIPMVPSDFIGPAPTCELELNPNPSRACALQDWIANKEEEKRIAEEQAVRDRYRKIPICYDDDEDYTIATTPVLSTKEPVDSLIMKDEHLDTISATESDEVIKSNPSTFDALKEHSEILSDSNNDSTSNDDDSYENIDYVDASPPDAEIVSLEVVEIVVPEVGGIDTDILLTIKDDILHEKLLNVNLFIANIEALKDNPVPSSDFVIKSPYTFPNSFLEGD